MLDLVLINGPSPQLEDDCMAPPVGLIELASYAELCKLNVKIIDAAGDVNFWDEVVPAKTYGFTVQSTQYLWVKNIIPKLRKMMDTKIVVGGHHVSALPNESLNDLNVDYVVIGDGEKALIDIVNNTVPKGIIVGDKADINHDYSINYGFINFNKYNRHINDLRAMTVMASRGCPYNCHFCAKLPGKFRYREANLVLQDIKYLRDTFDIHAIHFHDDNLLFPRHRAEIIANGLKDLGIIWRCLTRSDSVDKDIIQLIKDCGCAEVCFGVESGSDKILKFLNKGITVEQNKRAVKLCREIGLNVDVYLMVNIPGETIEDLELTKQFILDTKPTNWVVNSFIPTVGSKMWANPDKFGFKILNNDFTKFYSCGKHGRGGIVSISESGLSVDEVYRAREDLLDFLRKNVKSQYI